VASGELFLHSVRTVGNEESLVAGGHKVAGLAVGSVTDLIVCVSPSPNANLAGIAYSQLNSMCRSRSEWMGAIRTLGIAAWPLNRLRTRLSIPLGLRHEGSTPVRCQHCVPSSRCSSSLTFEAVGLMAVEALGVCIRFRQLRVFEVIIFGVAYAS
jgi:hypothetical protein